MRKKIGQGPTITSFTVVPTSSDGRVGYIPTGGKAKLSWEISNCESSCEIIIRAYDGLNYKDFADSFPNLPKKGSIEVSPTRSTHTLYMLTAKSGAPSDTKCKEVQLYIPDQPVKPFYFKITCPSEIRPCITTRIDAPDEKTAKEIAQRQGENCTAEKITEQQYYDDNTCR
jgi:hypothetical protein